MSSSDIKEVIEFVITVCFIAFIWWRVTKWQLKNLERCKPFKILLEKIDNFTLRDYFAGQALAGIMTNIKQDFGENPQEHIAKICYDYADALIKEREK